MKGGEGVDKKYYSLVKNSEKKEATLTIFGDITSWPWLENDVSSYNLSKELEELEDVDTIHVRINSYGGEVAEGLAIYNALRNHKATVKTYCYGFACSIASVIFMAGDERLMSSASMLMIHNAWTYASGNASELRKQADDLDKITQASINAYMRGVNITEEELRTLLDTETWLEYNEAVEKGFATGVYDEEEDTTKESQSARRTIFKMLLNKEPEEPEDPEGNPKEEDMEQYECGKCGYIHDGELPEFFVCPECGASKEEFKKVGEEPPKEDVTTYTCSECGYVHEGELPEFFVCPQCGADKDAFVKDGEEPPKEEEEIIYECSECGYLHEGELPEFFICPECGADKDAFVKSDKKDDDLTDDEKKTNQKTAKLFAKLLGGIDND